MRQCQGTKDHLSLKMKASKRGGVIGVFISHIHVASFGSSRRKKKTDFVIFCYGICVCVHVCVCVCVCVCVPGLCQNSFRVLQLVFALLSTPNSPWSSRGIRCWCCLYSKCGSHHLKSEDTRLFCICQGSGGLSTRVRLGGIRSLTHQIDFLTVPHVSFFFSPFPLVLYFYI